MISSDIGLPEIAYVRMSVGVIQQQNKSITVH